MRRSLVSFSFFPCFRLVMRADKGVDRLEEQVCSMG